MPGTLRRHVLAALGFLVLLASTAIGQVGPPRDVTPAQEPTGNGRLTVSVVAGDSGQPVRRARITLFGIIAPAPGAQGPAPGATGSALKSGDTVFVPVGAGPSMIQPLRVQRDGETNEQGRIEFTSLPAARYNLSVSPPSPFVSPVRSPSLQVKDGESTSLAIRLERGGAIMGRIVDEHGDPVAGVMPRVLSRQPIGSTDQLTTAGKSSPTDDRGTYRVYDLRPGDYYVLATEWSGRRAASSWEPHNGTIPTYYPGTPTLGGARLVTVRSGGETSGIDFGLVEGPLGRIKGTAVDSAGNQVGPPRGNLMLIGRGPDGFARQIFGSHFAPEGTYAFDNVPPGDYIVSASVRPGDQPGPDVEGVWVPVTMNGEDISLDLRTNTGATLSGHVTIEGTQPLPAPVGAAGTSSRYAGLHATIGVSPAHAMSGPGFAPGRMGQLGEDGTFQLTGVRGSVLLRVTSPLAPVKSIRRGGEDLIGRPLDLTGTERLDDIEIVLTTDTGHLTGMLTDGRGQPAPGRWLVAIPDNPKLWFPGSPSVRVTRSLSAEDLAQIAARAAEAGQSGGTPSSSRPGVAEPSIQAARPRAVGQYSFPRLASGRYYVVALPGEDANGINPMQFDAERLSQLREKAAVVTIVAGETASANLHVSK